MSKTGVIRRIVAGALLAAGIFALSACGGSETNEGGYSLDTLRSKTSAFDDMSDADMKRLSEGMCGSLDNGLTVEQVVGVTVDLDGKNARDYLGMLGYAVHEDCPNHADDLEQFVETYDS